MSNRCVLLNNVTQTVIAVLPLQVREMEEIIKRRYPNSLPALIYAAASAPGQAQGVATESPRKQSPTYAFLENRVKKLETELEEKDEEASRRIRCVEQKYNSLRLDYEDRIKELQSDLHSANERHEKTSRSNTRAQIFEEELQRTRETNDQKVKQLQTEIEVLQDSAIAIIFQVIKRFARRKYIWCIPLIVPYTNPTASVITRQHKKYFIPLFL